MQYNKAQESYYGVSLKNMSLTFGMISEEVQYSIWPPIFERCTPIRYCLLQCTLNSNKIFTPEFLNGLFYCGITYWNAHKKQ